MKDAAIQHYLAQHKAELPVLLITKALVEALKEEVK